MDFLPILKAAKILVVEDDLQVADHVGQLLREAGYVVHNAYNAGDALAEEHSRFNLAYVNGAMRDREGKLLLERIPDHSTFKGLPVLVITDNPKVAKSIVNGQMLHRPYTDEELLSCVKEMLDKPQTPKPPAPGVSTAKLSRNDPRTGTGEFTAVANIQDEATQPERSGFDALLQQQLAKLRTLSNLGRSISSVLDLSEVLNQIVEAATTLTHAEEGMLLLPDDENKALFIRAMKNIDDRSAGNFRIKVEDPLIGRVYQTGQAILVGDRGLQRVKTEYFVKSLLYVPLTYKGQNVGVLGVNNRRVDRVFTNHDQELLLDLAAHAAVAIENARLYEERLLQNRRLTTLVEAGKAVNSTLALDAVLSTICQQIIQVLNVNACLINQQDPANGELRPLASTRRAIWRLDQGSVTTIADRPLLKQSLEQNGFYMVTAQGETDLLGNERHILLRDGAEGMVMLPVRLGDQPATGILELYYRQPMPNVNSEFRARMRGLSYEILARLSQTPNKQFPSLSPAPAVPGLFEQAQKILDGSGANWLTLSLIKNSEALVRVMEFGATVFLTKPDPSKVIFPLSADAFGEQRSLSYHTRQTDLQSEVKEAMNVYGAAALLCLPLIVKGKPFGTVTIYDTLEARRFQPTEVDLAWALVTQAANAIDNARLYRDLGQSLTDLKDAQARLVQATRLATMGELAAVVAHQINNPLTTIMVDSEIILQEMSSTNSWYEGLTAIRRAGQRAHAVVKRLLSTARRDSSEQTPQPIDVHETINNTLELVTNHIERAKVKVSVELDKSEPCLVEALPGHLEDVWLNLLLNARDALVASNSSYRTIIIRSRRFESMIEIAVCDNGPGIPEKDLAEIFEPFFTTKPADEGTGLGLYVCKQIIDQCKGTISVKTVQNEGTCFYVKLPLHRA